MATAGIISLFRVGMVQFGVMGVMKDELYFQWQEWQRLVKRQASFLISLLCPVLQGKVIMPLFTCRVSVYKLQVIRLFNLVLQVLPLQVVFILFPCYNGSGCYKNSL